MECLSFGTIVSGMKYVLYECIPLLGYTSCLSSETVIVFCDIKFYSCIPDVGFVHLSYSLVCTKCNLKLLRLNSRFIIILH